MIIRTPNRDRYVIISKVPLEDKRLSWKARGLHAYLMSKPDHWTVIVKALVNEAPDGRDSVMTALQELERFGYIAHKATRDEKNRFDGTEWVMFEEPMNSTADGFSVSGSAASGKPDTSEQGLLVNNERSDSLFAVGEPEKPSRAEILFTTTFEHYPRKDARKVALKAFTARLNEKISPDDLLAATKNYVVACRGKEKQHIMLGSTFYGPNERWKDFLDPTPEQPGRTVISPQAVAQAAQEQRDWEAEIELRRTQAKPMPSERFEEIRRNLKRVGA